MIRFKSVSDNNNEQISKLIDEFCRRAVRLPEEILRLAKEKCGEVTYRSLKPVLADFKKELPAYFPDDSDCSPEVKNITPDRRRRGVANTSLKRLIDFWMS
jgi:hypothetical protein